MSAELFLQLAIDKGLLDEKTAGKVRAQLRDASRNVEPEKLAALLVKKERLTQHQAKALLDEMDAALAASQTIPSKGAWDSSLGLAPIEEEEDEVLPTPAPPKAAAAKPSPPPKSPQEALDDELGLTPIDDDDDEEATDWTPAVPVVELEPLEDNPPADAAEDVTQVDDLVEHHEPSDGAGPLHPALDELGDAAEEVASGPGFRRRRTLLSRLVPKFQVAKAAPTVRRRRANQWDSPLILAGTGGLILMTFIGILLYFLLTRGTGEEAFQLAEEDYQRQAYGQAIAKFDKFVSRFPNHGKVSLAKVRRGLAHLRESVEAQSWDQALARATPTLEEIKGEEAFGEGRLELAGILPEIYEGFVVQAQSATETAQKQERLAKASDALALVNNPEYLPTSTRTENLQRRLEELASDAALVERDINRDQELAAAIEKIRATTQAGKALQAYEVRSELLGRYPQLAANNELQQAVLAIVTAERSQVTSQEANLPAARDDPEAGMPGRVILADQHDAGTAPLDGQVATILAAGAAYGLEAVNGRPLWRRWVGYETHVAPQVVRTQSGQEALVVDGKRGELAMLDARTGALRWRLPLAGETLAPVVRGNRAWVAARTGRLTLIDLDRGVGLREAQMPQQLSTVPAVDREAGRVYLPAEHSSLYVLDADSLDCLAVAYVGHGSGSVTVPPVLVGGQLFVLENGGTDFAWLHLLGSQGEDAAMQLSGERVRLEGQVFGPPAVSGRRALISTDLGGLYVFEADPAAGAAVRLIAKTLPSLRETVNTYAIMDGNDIYVGGLGLAHYQLQPARGELVRRWIKSTEDVAVAGPQQLDEYLLFLSRPRRSRGTRADLLPLAAGRGASQAPQSVWSIDLGIPPAGPALLTRDPPRIVAVSSQGSAWTIGPAEMKSEIAVTARPPSASTVAARPFERAVTFAGGAAVYPAVQGQPRWLLFDPANDPSSLRLVAANIPETKVAAGPIAVGEQLALATADGPLYLLSPATGEPALMPFQPRLEPGQAVVWLEPSVIAEDPVQLIAADGAGNVYRLVDEPRPRPHLAAVAEVSRGTRLAASTAVGTDVVFVVSRSGTHDTMVMLVPADLAERGQQPLTGMVAWGPRRVGDRILVTTNADRLYAFALTGELAWETPLEFGALAGPPLPLGNQMLMTFVNGQVLLLDGATGDRLSQRDTGQPLGAGATLFEGRLLLLGRDSTLLITELPEVSAAAGPPRRPPALRLHLGATP